MNKSKPIARRTAVHEAGHAVIALLEGRKFDDIVAGTDQDFTAVVRNIAYRPGDDEVIRISLAGIMAARFIRRSWRSPFFETAANDIGIVADFVRGSQNIDFFLDYNIQRTEQLLIENWAAVETIAALFRRRRAVSFAEARNALESNNGVSVEPDGELGSDRWKPLEKNIRWRIEYPRGFLDAVADLKR